MNVSITIPESPIWRACAAMASDFLLGSSLGAGPAALFGISTWVVDQFTDPMAKAVISDKNNCSIKKIMALAITALGEIALSWKVLEFFGYSMTFKAAAILYGTTSIMLLTSAIALGVIFVGAFR